MQVQHERALQRIGSAIQEPEYHAYYLLIAVWLYRFDGENDL